VTELARMRRVYDAIEEPTDLTVSTAREVLLREIASTETPRQSRPRRRVFVAIAAAVFVGGLLVTPALGLGGRLLDLLSDRSGHSIDITMTGSVSQSSGTSTAGTSGPLHGEVRILCKGTLTGPQGAGSGQGRFILTGAISDRGRFVDGGFQGVHHEIDPHVRTLFGTKGTIRITIDGARGNVIYWRITKGTKTYAELRGRGLESGLYGSRLTS
jgi:hypothetical protein